MGIHGTKLAPAVNSTLLQLFGVSPPRLSRQTTFAPICATRTDPTARSGTPGAGEGRAAAGAPSSAGLSLGAARSGSQRRRAFTVTPRGPRPPSMDPLAGGSQLAPQTRPAKGSSARVSIQGRPEPTRGWPGTDLRPSPRVTGSSAYLTSPPAPAHPSSRAAPSAPARGTPGWSAAS